MSSASSAAAGGPEEAMTGAGLAPRAPDDIAYRLRQVPLILMYHAVCDTDDDPHQLAVSPRRFAGQMAWLARSGLRGVSIAELVQAMRGGAARNLVGITFDDGYTSVLKAAVPVLARHGFSATAFVISGKVGGVNDWDAGPVWPLLGEPGIAELAAAGIEIGSHSVSHARMAGLEPARLSAEAGESKAALRAITGMDIGGFAYPYGSMDPAAAAAVRAAGYSYACAVQVPRSRLGLMTLPRMYAGERDGPARMLAKRLLYRVHVTSREAAT